MTAITSTWTDLYDRLDHAATTLAELSRDENRTESDRDHLWSKAQGVRLALSYMQDMGGRENGSNDTAEVRAGMTEREAEVWLLVSKAAGAYLRLTEDETGHPMEREEICHAFHSIQGWLAGRPFMRALAEAHDD